MINPQAYVPTVLVFEALAIVAVVVICKMSRHGDWTLPSLMALFATAALATVTVPCLTYWYELGTEYDSNSILLFMLNILATTVIGVTIWGSVELRQRRHHH